jgi:hypothetical protein
MHSNYHTHSPSVRAATFIFVDKNLLYPVIIQGVSEIRVLILTTERTREFMKLFCITFCKIRKSIARIFAPQFLPNESICVIN